MHTYKLFDKMPDEVNLAFARDRGFGTLAVNHDSGPVMSQVPFVMLDDGAVAAMHLARGNPILNLIGEGAPAVLNVMGPDGYISPDWYEMEDQVPTWNYVSVTLRGRLEPGDGDKIADLVAFQSQEFENRIPMKEPWTMDKMSEGKAERMMRAIVPVLLYVEQVEGTWKLGQNKPDTAREAAAEMVGWGMGHELATLSALMRSAGEAEAE